MNCYTTIRYIATHILIVIMASYPCMIGVGELAATHELHIFLGPINPNTETVERYQQVVEEWNQKYPSTLGMKPCLLTLIFRDQHGKPTNVTVMQSARYVRSNDDQYVIAQAMADAKWFTDHGFDVVRRKIEASAYGISGIPQTVQEVAQYPSKYFEFHIKVGRKDASDTSAISEQEIEQLNNASFVCSKEYNIPVPLSYNNLKDKFNLDGEGHQRFLNVRFRGLGIKDIAPKLEDIKSTIAEQTRFKVLKVISEYVWYDDNTAMDHGWIDYSPAELENLTTYWQQ